MEESLIVQVVDYPNSTRAKKFFLTLMAGPPAEMPKAKGLDGSDEEEDEDGEGIKVGSGLLNDPRDIDSQSLSESE